MTRFIANGCIFLAGAVWGAGLTVASVAFLLGTSGPYVPFLLTVGPLVPVGDLLSCAAEFLCIVAAFYGTLTMLLWSCAGSYWMRMAATLLYATLPLGLVYGAAFPDPHGYAWTDLARELRHFRNAAEFFPVLFPMEAVALAAWHGFALWRLGRAWMRVTSPRTSFRPPRPAV